MIYVKGLKGRLRPLMGAVSFFEGIGRTIMDFGFGALLDKFEEYFGKPVTVAFTALIGMAVATLCGGIVYHHALQPLYRLIAPVVQGANINAPSVWRNPEYASLGGLALGCNLNFLGGWLYFYDNRQRWLGRRGIGLLLILSGWIAGFGGLALSAMNGGGY